MPQRGAEDASPAAGRLGPRSFTRLSLQAVPSCPPTTALSRSISGRALNDFDQIYEEGANFDVLVVLVALLAVLVVLVALIAILSVLVVLEVVLIVVLQQPQV